MLLRVERDGDGEMLPPLIPPQSAVAPFRTREKNAFRRFFSFFRRNFFKGSLANVGGHASRQRGEGSLSSSDPRRYISRETRERRNGFKIDDDERERAAFTCSPLKKDGRAPLLDPLQLFAQQYGLSLTVAFLSFALFLRSLVDCDGGSRRHPGSPSSFVQGGRLTVAACVYVVFPPRAFPLHNCFPTAWV